VMILILSSITGLYSSLVQKYTIDYEKMQETQAKMKVFQKEFREAQLSGDEKRVKKLQGKQERMMQDQLDLSRQQFTPMAIILVLSVPIFFWLLLRLPEVGTPVAIASGIVMPFLGAVSLSEMAFWIVPAWILWYMICSLTVSQVIRKSLNIGGL
ncbi:MAG: EMC3/TMCO1 family protein, partial [Methanoculleus chikugoensis]|nr:EMC3/TMCO1 family protein [Methanoculleus chikugoensis]